MKFKNGKMSGLALLFFPLIAIAEPITISGLNWTMAPDEIKQELTQNGYACEVMLPEIRPAWRQCKNGEKVVHIYADTQILNFSCEVFNGCSYSAKEVAQFAVDNGLVQELSYYQDLNDQGVITKGYRGRGQDGDVLDVKHFGPGTAVDSGVEMIIEKSNLGSGGVEF